MFEKLWEAYLKEKKYLGGLSQQTLDSYVDVYKRWVKHIGKVMPDALNIKEWVVKMTEDGLSPVTINISIRSWNVFLNWLHKEEHMSKFLKLQKVKEPKKAMIPIKEDDVSKLLKWKPNFKSRMESRQFAFLCTLADTGMRIDEVLTIEMKNIEGEL